MAIWGDYHTHSVYSHGDGTVEDNVKRAVELGLKEIGITDHGICAYPNNMPPHELDDFLSDVTDCRAKYPQINILAGIEANLISLSGRIDLTEQQQEKLDYIVFGYHYIRMLVANPVDMATLWLANLLPGASSAKRIVKNTDAYIKTMQKYRIAVIAHPQKSILCDLKVLGEAAKEYGVHVEVNEKNLEFGSHDFETLIKTGCKLIIVSDAHSPQKIGLVPTALEASRAAGIPDEAYANWERLPDLNFNPKTVLNRERFDR